MEQKLDQTLDLPASGNFSPEEKNEDSVAKSRRGENLEQYQFQKGVSGNPRGRPRKNPIDPLAKIDKRRLVRTLFESGAKDVIDMAIQKAKEGDTKAMALVLKYMVPEHKAEMTPVDLDLEEDASLSEKLAKLTSYVTQGKISPDAAAMVAKSLRDAVEAEKVLQAMSEISDLSTKIKNITSSGSRVI